MEGVRESVSVTLPQQCSTCTVPLLVCIHHSSTIRAITCRNPRGRCARQRPPAVGHLCHAQRCTKGYTSTKTPPIRQVCARAIICCLCRHCGASRCCRCVCVCVCVCMYAHARMHACIMYVCMHVLCMYACMYYVCMHACMYACVCVNIHTQLPAATGVGQAPATLYVHMHVCIPRMLSYRHADTHVCSHVFAAEPGVALAC